MYVHWYPIAPTTLHLRPSNFSSILFSICLSTAAAVIALLLGYGLVTLPEMLLQPPASVKQSPLHFSRRLPNALSKCGHPEQKLNIQGPQTITMLSMFVFFSTVNINLSFCSMSLLNCRLKKLWMQGCHLFSSKTLTLLLCIDGLTYSKIFVCHDVFFFLLTLCCL